MAHLPIGAKHVTLFSHTDALHFPSASLTSKTPDPFATEQEPTARIEPAVFIPEPEPNTESVQVCKLATTCITEGILGEFEGMNWSSAHNPKGIGAYTMLGLKGCYFMSYMR